MVMALLRKITERLLIVCNIIMGVLFLAGAFGGSFDPETYWFLSLFTLALPYFIFILLVFFVFWIFIKPVWCLISVLFLAIGWSAVNNIIPPRLHSAFTMNKNPRSIRVMSWNVEQFNIQNYKNNPSGKSHMLNLINEYSPDIACLQEAVAGESKEAINYFPDIVKALNFKDNFFAYRLADNFDRYHHFGTIIFSRYPIIRKQFMVNNPDDYNSTFQYVDVLIGQDTVRVFNMHLQSLKFSKENRNYLDSLNLNSASASESMNVVEKIKSGVMKRAIQARFARDEINHTPYPKIICGDFNDVPVSYAYNIVGKGLQNAFVEKGAGLSPTFIGISPTLRIDNIFVDSNFVVTQFKRIKKVLSDHYPIITDVELKPRH